MDDEGKERQIWFIYIWKIKERNLSLVASSWRVAALFWVSFCAHRIIESDSDTTYVCIMWVDFEILSTARETAQKSQSFDFDIY